MTKNYFGQYSMVKNLKDNEKSVINNYYNNKGYSFESNNFKNSLYLYGNGGNSNKILFNLINIMILFIWAKFDDILYFLPLYFFIKINDNKSINRYNNLNVKPSPISFKFKELKKELNVSVSDSNSCSSENHNSQNYFNSSNKSSKKRLITDYSKSTLNIIDDLNIFDEIPDLKRNKASKSNNIMENNLALNLNIDGLYINKKNHNNKNKVNIKKNNKVLKNNNVINKKTCNYNLATTKKNRKKITINDDNNNSYYHLEDKYYSITTTNHNYKNKEIEYINKRIPSKNIETKGAIYTGCVSKNYLDKNKFSEKCSNLNNNNIKEKSYKSIIFKQKIDNNSLNNDKLENNKNTLKISIKNDNQSNSIFNFSDIKMVNNWIIFIYQFKVILVYLMEILIIKKIIEYLKIFLYIIKIKNF